MTTQPTLIAPNWSAPKNIFAYTTTRIGGVSEGVYQGLNVGGHVGDHEKNVAVNRAMLPEAQKIVWLNQVHGNNVVALNSNEHFAHILKADAAITDSSAYHCAVMTADCVPILLCDSEGTQVAAVHAGWQGMYKEIIAATIARFNCEPEDLMAWIGPSICGDCYEVDRELAQRFQEYPEAVSPGKRQDKFQLDLPTVAEYQLSQIGVGHIFNSKLCTYCQPDTFYSHRRATHNGQSTTGRIVSVIGLR